ncbi:hypothetical protein F5X98DRAFT_359998 [Xylaria grammica]|nr:hypothetical protein F5X98DRAFT_359998 [Xylaria grammica]
MTDSDRLQQRETQVSAAKRETVEWILWKLIEELERPLALDTTDLEMRRHQWLVQYHAQRIVRMGLPESLYLARLEEAESNCPLERCESMKNFLEDPELQYLTVDRTAGSHLRAHSLYANPKPRDDGTRISKTSRAGRRTVRRGRRSPRVQPRGPRGCRRKGRGKSSATNMADRWTLTVSGSGPPGEQSARGMRRGTSMGTGTGTGTGTPLVRRDGNAPGASRNRRMRGMQ